MKLRKMTIAFSCFMPFLLSAPAFAAAGPKAVCSDFFQNETIETIAELPGETPFAGDRARLVLRTERLELRPVATTEFKYVRKVWRNDRVTKMSQDTVDPKDIDDILQDGVVTFAELKTAMQNESSLLVNFGIFREGAFVGIMQLSRGFDELDLVSRSAHDDANWFSIGYHLDPRFWGRGFATEAAARLLEFVFEDLSAEMVVAEVAKTNHDSIRVLTKIGFEPMTPKESASIENAERVVHRYEIGADFQMREFWVNPIRIDEFKTGFMYFADRRRWLKTTMEVKSREIQQY